MFFSRCPYADTSVKYVEKDGTINSRGSIFAVGLGQAGLDCASSGRCFR
jgi:hypothetical protein